jgi:predicted PurR-regulated permease PerM
VVLAVWFGVQLLWATSSLVFLVFLATLFGLAVAQGVDRLERLGVRRGIASALLVFGTVGGIGGVLGVSAPTLAREARVLETEVPAALGKLQGWLAAHQDGWMGQLLPSAPVADSSAVRGPADTALTAGTAGDTTAAAAPGPGAPAAEAPSAGMMTMLGDRLSTGLAGASRLLLSLVSGTAAVLGALVLVMFLAIYIGAEPEVYHGWIVAGVPAESRAGVREVLARMATVLRKWLVTQLIAMGAIGSVSLVVLLLLDVKGAAALAFIAGLLEFVPTVGPLLSAIPAVLMGFVDSPEKALAVAAAYWGIQFLENNLLIPTLMRGEMDLPPAITLVAQALMTILFGFLGLMVAVPLTSAVLVPLRMRAEREDARERALAAGAEASGAEAAR